MVAIAFRIILSVMLDDGETLVSLIYGFLLRVDYLNYHSMTCKHLG